MSEVCSDAEAAWDELADRRERELEAGVVEAVPLEVAIARLEARLAEEHRNGWFGIS